MIYYRAAWSCRFTGLFEMGIYDSETQTEAFGDPIIEQCKETFFFSESKGLKVAYYFYKSEMVDPKREGFFMRGF